MMNQLERGGDLDDIILRLVDKMCFAYISFTNIFIDFCNCYYKIYLCNLLIDFVRILMQLA